MILSQNSSFFSRDLFRDYSLWYLFLPFNWFWLQMVLILFINTRIRDDTRYDKFQRKYFSLIFTQLKCKSYLRRVKSWNKGNSSSEYAKFEHRSFKWIFPRSISLNILIKTHFDFKKKSSQPFLTWNSMMKLRKQIRHSWNKFGWKKRSSWWRWLIQFTGMWQSKIFRTYVSQISKSSCPLIFKTSRKGSQL